MPKVPFWVFILLAALYFSAVRIDTMDVDASQYAEISREMLKSHDYLHVYDRGMEYLDKPPFLFWVSSISMGIFGVNNFGYKLPSILFALWALYALYRLTKRLYDEETGRMAALVLGTCQGMFLMTNDIRCDTILMSWVITAIWAIKECEELRKWQFVILGTVSIACGMMTKGPIALLVPLFSFGSDWVLKRKWKNIFNPWHLFDACIIAVLLIPMSIGLYQQFDMHPEKSVNGMQHVSGLRFFFWTQSFGRITGESPWSNGAGFDFLLSNMFWSFLPWIFLFLLALILNVIGLFKQKFRLQPEQEWISTGGFILTYIALGSSRYQLPHYIFVAFPLAAIMVAKLLRDFFTGSYPRLYSVAKPFHMLTAALLVAGASLLVLFVFPGNMAWIITWVVLAATWVYLVLQRRLRHKLLWAGVAAIILVNVIFTNHFYACLLQYQLGSQAGRFIKKNGLPATKIYTFAVDDAMTSMSFYAQALIPGGDDINSIKDKSYVLASARGIEQLSAAKYRFDTVRQFQRYKVTELTPEFLDPATRSRTVTAYYLVRFK
ncbi:MAG: glycosyltransferase family 39 protein [Bacteroidetes bacterium]|nr:glycosyltransferase family 39 protein [Bacteroidota bacterium]